MKRFLYVAMFCALLLASQFGCSNSKQPNTVTEKNVPSANAVVASPEIEDLNRLISKLTYYRSPRNLQDAKPQSIEEIKATFGKQEPDVDPVIEGIYKELSDKYKSDQEFLLALNHVFLKYLFMIEDEPRFAAIINQMPNGYVYGPALKYKGAVIAFSGGSLSSTDSFKKEDLLNMLKKIKNVDRVIQSSLGSYEKLAKLFNAPDGKYFEEPYGATVGVFEYKLFATQAEPGCDGGYRSMQFYRRIEQLEGMLLNTVENDIDATRLGEVLKRISVTKIAQSFKREIFSEEEFHAIEKVITDYKYQKIVTLKPLDGQRSLEITNAENSIFKISRNFYLLKLSGVPNDAQKAGYVVIKKLENRFLPIFYIEESDMPC